MGNSYSYVDSWFVCKQIKSSTTDARGRGTAITVVNTCNTRPKLHYCLSLELASLCTSITAALYPTTLGKWKSMCMYVCVEESADVWWAVQHAVLHWETWEISISGGVGTLKREHRFPLSRKRTTRCFGPRWHHCHTAEVATLTWHLWVYCTAGCVCVMIGICM